jgi:hypothetical protein
MTQHTCSADDDALEGDVGGAGPVSEPSSPREALTDNSDKDPDAEDEETYSIFAPGAGRGL